MKDNLHDEMNKVKNQLNEANECIIYGTAILLGIVVGYFITLIVYLCLK